MSGLGRGIHRRIGLVLALPLVLWASTGLVFLVKPGYGAAYAPLRAPLVPLSGTATLPARPDWLEVRRFATVLGEHVVVRTADGLHQVDPVSGAPRQAPPAADLEALMRAALAADPARYGSIVSRDGLEVTTSTGARVRLDWDTMTFSQRGRDTDLIDGLYRVHYLQWTGIAAIDRVLGVVGPVGMIVLTAIGLALSRERKASRAGP